jgi:tetratricopeptide (TPR) repeat protein
VRGLRIDGVLARLDRLPAILNKGSPVGPERHVSLSNLLDWSYGTLNAAEQVAFCRLGIFPADFSADAGLTVIGTDAADDSADLLFDLVDACMVRSEDSAEPRYRLHETMQEFALEKLKTSGEYDRVAERFTHYLIEIFTRADREWETTPEPEWLARCWPEIANVRTALDWALADSGRSSLAIELAGVTARLWEGTRRLADGRRYLDRAVNLLGPDTPPAAAGLLLRYAGILWRSADRSRAVALLEQSAVLYRQIGDIPTLGSVLGSIGSNLVFVGRHEEAAATLAEAEEILASGDRAKSFLNIVNSLGTLALTTNDTAEAARCFSQARDQARVVNDVLRENIYVGNLGELEFRLGAIDRGVDHAREAANGFRSANLQSYLGVALVNLASYLALRGDHAEARAAAEEGLSLLREDGGYWLRLCLQAWALLGALDERYADAARLLDWVNADYSRSGEIRTFTEQQIYDTLAKLLADNLGEDERRIRGVDASVWSEERAVEFALQRLVLPQS